MPTTSRSATMRPRFAATRTSAALLMIMMALASLALLGGSGRAAALMTQSSGVDVPVSQDTDSSGALLAARALADGAPGAQIIPASVTADLGYEPGIDLGLAANAEGDCSSPVPLPDRFEPACRVHDLGYDLLRVADRHGDEIPRGLRSDLDDLLARQMRDSCGDHGPCRLVARVAETAVHLNTVRQGHGAPVEEWFPW